MYAHLAERKFTNAELKRQTVLLVDEFKRGLMSREDAVGGTEFITQKLIVRFNDVLEGKVAMDDTIPDLFVTLLALSGKQELHDMLIKGNMDFFAMKLCATIFTRTPFPRQASVALMAVIANLGHHQDALDMMINYLACLNMLAEVFEMTDEMELNMHALRLVHIVAASSMLDKFTKELTILDRIVDLLAHENVELVRSAAHAILRFCANKDLARHILCNEKFAVLCGALVKKKVADDAAAAATEELICAAEVLAAKEAAEMASYTPIDADQDEQNEQNTQNMQRCKIEDVTMSEEEEKLAAQAAEKEAWKKMLEEREHTQNATLELLARTLAKMSECVELTPLMVTRSGMEIAQMFVDAPFYVPMCWALHAMANVCIRMPKMAERVEIKNLYAVVKAHPDQDTVQSTLWVLLGVMSRSLGVVKLKPYWPDICETILLTTNVKTRSTLCDVIINVVEHDRELMIPVFTALTPLWNDAQVPKLLCAQLWEVMGPHVLPSMDPRAKGF